VPSYYFAISGRVQGVGFRAFVKAIADSRGVRGSVWNTYVGTVEATAYHESEAVLADFESRLWKGPGRVDSVARSDGSAFPVGPGFEIRRTI
jgi:acylphosphatase